MRYRAKQAVRASGLKELGRERKAPYDGRSVGISTVTLTLRKVVGQHSHFPALSSPGRVDYGTLLPNRAVAMPVLERYTAHGEMVGGRGIVGRQGVMFQSISDVPRFKVRCILWKLCLTLRVCVSTSTVVPLS